MCLSKDSTSSITKWSIHIRLDLQSVLDGPDGARLPAQPLAPEVEEATSTTERSADPDSRCPNGLGVIVEHSVM